MRGLRNWWSGGSETAGLWRGPLALGLGAAIVLWVVWYFTKAPCTMEGAQAGICNAGTLARYIDHQILGQCILLGIAAAAVRGGYNEIMVSRERKRADDAEARAEEAEERLRQERRRSDERMEEALAKRRADIERQEAELEQRKAERRAERERQEAEWQAEREQREAELEQREAERRAERELDRAERQALLNTMVQINNTLAQLAANQRNGQSAPPQD